MSSRSIRMLVAGTAALLLTAPGFVGVASAHDNGPSHGWSQSVSWLTTDLRTAVKNARLAYFNATQKAKSDYRDDLIAIRASIQTGTDFCLKAVQKAKSDYDAAAAADANQETLDALRATLKTAVEAYRTALMNAKKSYEADVAAVQKSANDAITAAGAAYTKTVKEAFATYATGTTPPAGLLLPPGHGLGKGNGIGHGDQGLYLGRSESPSHGSNYA